MFAEGGQPLSGFPDMLLAGMTAGLGRRMVWSIRSSGRRRSTQWPQPRLQVNAARSTDTTAATETPSVTASPKTSGSGKPRSSHVSTSPMGWSRRQELQQK